MAVYQPTKAAEPDHTRQGRRPSISSGRSSGAPGGRITAS
jgi:hypothetical protein